MWDDLGTKFWLKFAGVFVAGGIALFIFLLIFTKAVYAWGIFGAFLVVIALALLAAWIHDRREQRRYQESS
jgi:predicted PurR-regulated permease PerM